MIDWKEERTETGATINPLRFDGIMFLRHYNEQLKDPKYLEDPFVNGLINLLMEMLKDPE